RRLTATRSPLPRPTSAGAVRRDDIETSCRTRDRKCQFPLGAKTNSATNTTQIFGDSNAFTAKTNRNDFGICILFIECCVDPSHASDVSTLHATRDRKSVV